MIIYNMIMYIMMFSLVAQIVVHELTTLYGKNI